MSSSRIMMDGPWSMVVMPHEEVLREGVPDRNGWNHL